MMREYEEEGIYFIGKENSSLEECITYLSSQEVLGLDIETTFKYNGIYSGEGLDPHLSNIVMVQIGTIERQYVIDARYVDIYPLKAILENNNIVKAGHNIKFEYKHLLGHGIRLQNVYDSMVVEQILYTGFRNMSFGLKDLAKRYLNIVVDKGTRLEFLRIKDNAFTKTQIKYGAYDTVLPLKIRELQLVQVDKKGVENTVSLEMLFLLVVGDIEYKGMHFDTSVWEKTYEQNRIRYESLEKELNEFVLAKYPTSMFIDKQLDLFSSEIKCNIQWTSSTQVVKFFRFLNMCPLEVSKTTKKLSYTVNANILRASLNTFNATLPEDLKWLIQTYLNFKEAEQSVTTFGTDFFKNINPITKRLHSNYRQILNTGRISSSGPNLQNIPSDNSFRSAFTAPSSWKIVNADYSGQEQIILANKSNDKDLQYFYKQNLGDMHKQITVHIKLGEFMETPEMDNHELSLQLNAA
ncbi:MAG: DNA polymerase [Chitinophagaceae bacterium]